jgi:hypothetical protein
MRNKNVFGFQVSVDDVHLVHVPDTLDDLPYEITCLLLRETFLRLPL